MEKTLTLPLKRKWFDMIKSGEKKEEYREITPYWTSRLEKIPKSKAELILKKAEHILNIEFTLGYPRKDDKLRRMKFKNPAVRIGYGKPEWGAEPGKRYFVITWEE